MSKSEINGTVVLGFGPQEMDWLGKVAKLCGRGAVMAPDVARMAGANLAGGTPAALAALRERLAPGAMQAQAAATPDAPAGALQWLAFGERGMSSEALFLRLTGISPGRPSRCEFDERDRTAHPYDPDDLRRCRLMLEAVPAARARLQEAAELSPAWAALVAIWPELEATMDGETPDWRDPKCGGTAPATYQLMKRAIGR